MISLKKWVYGLRIHAVTYKVRIQLVCYHDQPQPDLLHGMRSARVQRTVQEGLQRGQGCSADACAQVGHPTLCEVFHSAAGQVVKQRIDRQIPPQSILRAERHTVGARVVQRL